MHTVPVTLFFSALVTSSTFSTQCLQLCGAMHLCFPGHLVLHWLLAIPFPHSALQPVVLWVLTILPFYVHLNQQERTVIREIRFEDW